MRAEVSASARPPPVRAVLPQNRVCWAMRAASLKNAPPPIAASWLALNTMRSSRTLQPSARNPPPPGLGEPGAGPANPSICSPTVPRAIGSEVR